ncbi:MAG: DsbA family protein [Paracoccus sp. (in: a-proteobacteria)]|uniref:DsbA family protein n=1 Tax=Paracoccus sp. TaxID=267 RepID=UPI00391A009D
MTADFSLSYFFDPLCGWCYASAPALAVLARHHGDRLTMRPSGLFAAPRPVSSIADHAWTNDRRIGAMTGQTFSAAYHRNVLLAPDGIFSSAALTRALVALGQSNRALEPAFLHAAQIARYVDGRDTSRPDVVAGIAAMVARAHGHNARTSAWRARLAEDAALHRATTARVAGSRDQMDLLGIRGVPQLALHLPDETRLIDTSALYAGGEALLSEVAAHLPQRLP